MGPNGTAAVAATGLHLGSVPFRERLRKPGIHGMHFRMQNRFNQGIDALPATTAQTAEECATACNNDPKCQWLARRVFAGRRLQG